MPSSLSQRYLSALSQLSQFQCAVQDGNPATLTHALTGVQVSAETGNGAPASENGGRLRLTFAGGHSIDVVAARYLELQLAEDAAHRMHAVREGSGEIHRRAAQTWERLREEHNLGD